MRSAALRLAPLLGALLSHPAHASLPPVVSAFHLEVPPGRDLFEAHALVRADEGMPLDRSVIDRHLERLGELGWVEAVEVRIQDRPDGSLLVRYRLEPRGTIERIRFEGSSRFTENDLRAVIASAEGRGFDLRRAHEDAQAISRCYEEAGYPFSGVLTHQGVRFEAGTLVFRVTEAHLPADSALLVGEPGASLAGSPVTADLLRYLLARAHRRGILDLERTRVDVDRNSGRIRLVEDRTSASSSGAD